MECPICWDSLVSPTSPTVSIPCGHLFHETCLTPILRSRLSGRGGDPDCPTCRAPIKLIPQRDLERVPSGLREYCLPAIRRVYLTPPDTSGVDTQREIDMIYARLSETQEKLQNSMQKEKSAEHRLRAIMDLWKQEQAKNDDLQLKMRVMIVEDRHHAAKAAPAPAPAPAPVPLPLATTSAPALTIAPGYVPPSYGQRPPLPTPPMQPMVPTDPWHTLEQEILSTAVSSDNFWRMFPPRPVPPQLPPPLLTSHPAEYRPYPFGLSYPQALAPVPQQPPALQPGNMPLPSMPPTPMQSVIARAGPVDGSGPGYTLGAQPHAQMHYAPAAGAPAGYPGARTPQPATPNLALEQMRAPAASTDPRPRHLSGAFRERECARIRLQMEHARLQHARVRQTSQQSMPGPSQRWGGTA
ncbi:hypothetical protein PsYK624_121900 [Phanerochaete sordida]|uniref:RING-type domain-containing protein n=1 Tax=Phanerochaete sordida TaxID=48140 RepID=A0A9P3LJ96_9APHY|nr:hypothetical protein PsYK624_121900 [Phanerochaete sordida]